MVEITEGFDKLERRESRLRHRRTHGPAATRKRQQQRHSEQAQLRQAPGNRSAREIGPQRASSPVEVLVPEHSPLTGRADRVQEQV